MISLSKSLPNAPRLFQLQVNARDGGGLFALKPANVTISVSDRNVPIPIFSESKYSFSVSEMDKVDTMVGQVRATLDNSAHGKFLFFFFLMKINAWKNSHFDTIHPKPVRINLTFK